MPMPQKHTTDVTVQLCSTELAPLDNTNINYYCKFCCPRFSHLTSILAMDHGSKTSPLRIQRTNRCSADSRSQGGLTPLPAEDEPSLVIRSSIDVKNSSILSFTSQELQQDEEGGLSAETDALINDILKRQELWERERAGAEAYVMHLKAGLPPSTFKSENMTPFVEAEPTKISDSAKAEIEQYDKIMRGLEEIRQLDAVLLEKTTRVLSGRLDDRSDHSIADDSRSEADDVSVDLKSVHSMDTRTFLTEPKWRSRAKRFERERSDQSLSDARKLGAIHVPLKKSDYRQGDFIQRNIVLGPEARYYSAMTDTEKDRVESILQREEYENIDGGDTVDDANSTAASTILTRPTSTASILFTEPEMSRLAEIDRALENIIPASEWDSKSVVWSAIDGTDGRATPVSLFSAKVRVRDVEAVMHDKDLLVNQTPENVHLIEPDQARRLQDIDTALSELQNLENVRPLTRADMEQLLEMAEGHWNQHIRVEEFDYVPSSA
ncbi:hypothetical protein BJ742DRAFT_879464 [Cladochytrium replicatum]|nr:hypothetical protein BJ742DRAFT_879464 [Cladochytrium replicatum]